jgi:hypothetical protein
METTYRQLSSIYPETILEKPSSNSKTMLKSGDLSKIVSEWIVDSPNFAE